MDATNKHLRTNHSFRPHSGGVLVTFCQQSEHKCVLGRTEIASEDLVHCETTRQSHSGLHITLYCKVKDMFKLLSAQVSSGCLRTVSARDVTATPRLSLNAALYRAVNEP